MRERQEKDFMAHLGSMMQGGQQQQQRAPYGQSWQMQPPPGRICYHCRAAVQPGENHNARNCPVKKKEEEEAATAKAEKIVQEMKAKGEIVVKQELEVSAGCMRSLGAYSAGNGLIAPGTQPNFGASVTSMTPGFTTPGSTTMVPTQLQPPPPPQPMQMQQQLHDQMQQMQAGITAEMQSAMADLKASMHLSLAETVQQEMQPISTRVAALASDIENGKAARMLMRGEVSKMTSKYDALLEGVKSMKALEQSVTGTMQSALKRIGALEAAPPPARRRDNAGNAVSRTPATAKGKAAPGRLSKKAKAALAAAEAEADAEDADAHTEDEDEAGWAEDNVPLADLAAHIVAEGAAGARPQRTTPPRLVKKPRTTIRLDS